MTHTLPALTTLRRHQPQARLTWLVEATALDLIEAHPALDRILVWRRREWTQRAKSGRWLAALGMLRRFVRDLRDTEYDLVIDFQALLKSAFWVALSRSPRKAGYGPGLRHDERSYLFLNERVPVADPNAHAIERNLRLLEGLGFPRLPLRYDLPIGPASEAQAEALLRECGVEPGREFVAINTLTRWPTKNWYPERFAAVADGLEARGLPAVFTGAPGDRAGIDAVAATLRSPVRRVDGRTSLKTLAAVFRRARVVLSTDTGPMHLAVAVGTPVVALFGPTSPGYTGPYGGEHLVLRSGVPCSPCYRKVCRTTQVEPHGCMLRIEPGEVVEAVWRQAARAGSDWERTARE